MKKLTDAEIRENFALYSKEINYLRDRLYSVERRSPWDWLLQLGCVIACSAFIVGFCFAVTGILRWAWGLLT